MSSNYYHKFLGEDHQQVFETQSHLSLMLCTLAMCMRCTTCSQSACGGTARCPINLGTHHSSLLHCDSLGVASCHCNDVIKMLDLRCCCSFAFLFVCLSTFSAICSLMAAVTILTSLVYVSQHLTITSKWHKWVCGVVIHPIILMISENWKPDWLASSVFVLRKLLGQSSLAALLCWGSCLRRYGNIKSKLSVLICPTVWAILSRS